MNNRDNPDIIDFLSKHIPISDDLAQLILEYSQIKSLKKGITIVKEGQIAKECFFILKGCMKKYYLIDGEEKITQFYTEGEIITPSSYTIQEPSKYYISTTEKTIVSFGNPDSENEIYKNHPELESLTRKLGEIFMVKTSNEFDNWVNHNPEERYLLLVKNRPDLIQRIPQYDIANYLGIRPESLSRIRKRLIN